jgi:CRP-like cAMP-binding protein
MTIAYFKAGDFVFKYGDLADCSFTILKGSASVHLPIRVDEFRSMKSLTIEFQEDLPSEDQQEHEEKRPRVEFREVRTLHSGDTFGELALITNKPRSATLMAQTELILSRLSKEEFSQVLLKIETGKLNRKIGFIQTIHVFRNWTKQSIRKMTYFIRRVKFKQGTVVYTENSPSEDVFIVKTGEFKFYKQLRQEATQAVQRRRSASSLKLHTDFKGSREIFGAADVIEGRPRQTTCECCSPTGTLYAIAKADFILMIQRADSWEYLVKVHEQQEAWTEQKLDRLKRAEDLLNKLNVEAKPATPVLKLMRTSSVIELKKAEDLLHKFNDEARPTQTRIAGRSRPMRSLENAVEPKELPKTLKKSSSMSQVSLNLQSIQSPVKPAGVRSLSNRSPNSMRTSRVTSSFKDFYSGRSKLEWQHTPLPQVVKRSRASKVPLSYFASGSLAVSTKYKFIPSISGIQPPLSLLTKERKAGIFKKFRGPT